MIAHVRGEVVHRDSEAVVIDVGGLGWLVHVAGLQDVPPPGQVVHLHTSLQVRDDAMDLYGFVDRPGLTLFELLITAAGVGPKLALAALRTHPPATLRDAIATGDQATLTDVPGVGKKVAQRLVLELGDKVGGAGFDPSPGTNGDAGDGDGSPRAQASEALAQLGYTRAEIAAALGNAPGTGGVEALVRHALRSMGT